MGEVTFKTFQVRGEARNSDHGTAKIDIAGFKYPGKVYVALAGWSLKNTSGEKQVKDIGIWSQIAIPGGYGWSHEFPVDRDGHIRGQYYAFVNDGTNKNNFDIIVNCLAIQVI